MSPYCKQAPRILPYKKEVIGYFRKGIDTKKCMQILDFFCNKLKEESSQYALDDTIEEFGIQVELKENMQPEKEVYPEYTVYKVYIG